MKATVRPSLFSFPEAGGSRYPLEVIFSAFEEAGAQMPATDLRGSRKGRVTLENHQLVRALRKRGFGQAIWYGAKSQSYRVYFPADLVTKAVEILVYQDAIGDLEIPIEPPVTTAAASL